MRIMRHFFHYLLMLAVLAGCAAKKSPDAISGETKAETAVSDDATRTKVEGTAAGVSTGAATRVLLKAVPGGKKIKRMIRYGRGLTETIGGSGGHLLGSTIADRKQFYMNEEERLNGEISIFQQLNQKLSTYNSATIKDIADLRQQISEIEKKNKGKQVDIAFSAKSKESFAKKITADKVTAAKLAAELSDLAQYYQSIHETGAPTKVVALRQEMESLQKLTTQFESSNQELARLVASIPVRN